MFGIYNKFDARMHIVLLTKFFTSTPGFFFDGKTCIMLVACFLLRLPCLSECSLYVLFYLFWIWRDYHHQYVSWSYQVRLLHTKFLNSTFLILTDQQSIPRWLKNEEYESDTETIEDWEEWNTNLLNFFIFKINIVDGIDVTKINISWASWSCCFQTCFFKITGVFWRRCVLDPDIIDEDTDCNN